MGWVATASLAKRGKKLTVLRTDTVETGNDRDSVEPYHVAAGFDGLTRLPPPGDPETVVEKGLRKQRRVARQRLGQLVSKLGAGNHSVTDAVILTGRGKPAASLSKILASHAQIHVAEGLAVRQSVEEAFAARNIKVHRLDEKSLTLLAEEKLGLTESEAFAVLSEARGEGVGVWKKEQKICALAAWLAVV